MEEYKNYLIQSIMHNEYETIEEIELDLFGKDCFILNKNEEGRLHSKYLGDRYEPAIQFKIDNIYINYYLFDGEIKDCTHPFHIRFYNDKVEEIVYYSSERIENGEPIHLRHNSTYYNQYPDSFIIIDEYESKIVNERMIGNFSELCEEMEEPPKFKFAD